MLPSWLGVGVFGKLPAARKRKDRQRNRLARSQRLRLSREPKARWRPGSADPTAPEQISQAPGLREVRFAVSQQILPLTGNRKPASERAHWLQPVPMLVQAQVVPRWGTGRPAEFSPSGFHPVAGIAYRQEDRRVRLLNRVDSATACGRPHTLSGNEKFEFFGAPSPGGRSVREISSREETERPPEEST